ncbi:hypothetical protein NCZ17_06625 [Acinetobacter modestus]|uniref:hypothetical protein n=1 Tax=Acinetobacter modestus TaxID=1776740 RepID=UPI00202E1442|nr:hypothetical protein [Acinetobacter modestus]MCM1959045.1 hypothetical protein [Acinetobacter modestus]
MKPCSRSVKFSNNFFQTIDFGTKNTVASIKGSVKKLGVNYQNATVALFNKSNLSLIALRKPDSNGMYDFIGLNNSLNTFIIAFDSTRQYNAVIADMVVPK